MTGGEDPEELYTTIKEITTANPTTPIPILALVALFVIYKCHSFR